jgi:hypothetical protein
MASIITSVLPPEIQQHFDRNLLAFPGVGDNLKRLWQIYLYIKTLKHKSNKFPEWQAKVARLEQEFLELYGRQEAKEIEHKKEDKKPAMFPFYYIKLSRKSDNTILSGLQLKRLYVKRSRVS